MIIIIMIMMMMMMMSCRLYCRAKQQNEVPPPPIQPTISEHFYRCTFNTKFNLGFGTPRSDTWTRCDELAIAIDAAHGPEKDMLQKEQDDHQAKAKAGYTRKREEKQVAKESWRGMRRLGSHHSFCSKDSVDMITYDFQQNLPTLNLHHSEVFYMRQLWVYNFGIHDCISDVRYMCMFGEHTAKRDANAVASCASTPSSRNIEAEQGNILEEFAPRFYCLELHKISEKVHVLNMKMLSGHQKQN